MNKLDLLDEVKKVQTNKRYIHTMGVRYTAACLAMKYDYSVEDAEIAGILHDCAKCISDEEMLSKCREYNIPIRDIEEKVPYLLHGKLGAYYANQIYHIEDQEILSAITYHTTGKPNMTLLEKIIFVADYIEPNRAMIQNLSRIRKIAFEDIDQATYMILLQTLNYLKESKREIDDLTEETFKFYKEVIRNKKLVNYE